VVPISLNYPFFFKPIQDGMDRPKTELAYRVPASKFTRRKLDNNENPEDIEGLDTTIDWKNTGDNSYDGEKLKLLVHDESGKWLRPDNILKNFITILMLQKETAMDRLVQDYIVCSYLWNGRTKDSLILMGYLYSIRQEKQLKASTGMK
jgi:hypothetical protein